MAILQDKIVLVTGAGAGIGRATALAMAAEGATVAAADIDPAAAQRTAEAAAGNTGRARSCAGVAAPSDWSRRRPVGTSTLRQVPIMRVAVLQGGSARTRGVAGSPDPERLTIGP